MVGQHAENGVRSATKNAGENMPKVRAQLAHDAGEALRAAGTKGSVVAGWYDRHPSDLSREIRGVRSGTMVRMLSFVQRLALERKGNVGAVLARLRLAAVQALASDLWPDEIGARFHALRVHKSELDAEEFRAAVDMMSLMIREPDSTRENAELRALINDYEPKLIECTEACDSLVVLVRAFKAARGWS